MRKVGSFMYVFQFLVFLHTRGDLNGKGEERKGDPYEENDAMSTKSTLTAFP